jgi:chemotaxis protein methyltransferase CheR
MTPSDFAYVAKLLFDRSAIVLEPGKEYLVDSRLLPLSRKHGLSSVVEYIQKLRTTPLMADEVVEAMVTTETSFFRDGSPFETLRTTVLPELTTARQKERRLTIWCAASASGQEPYTIAIILREYFPELLNWQIDFLATDLSQEMVLRTREGKYSQIEVNRGLPAALLVKYFDQEGTTWQARLALRSMISVRQLNLAATWPAMMQCDLIFIRNVMIYFDLPTKKSILSRMAKLVRPDGYLVLGGAETTFNLEDSFQRVDRLKSGFFQLRSGDKT